MSSCVVKKETPPSRLSSPHTRLLMSLSLVSPLPVLVMGWVCACDLPVTERDIFGACDVGEARKDDHPTSLSFSFIFFLFALQGPWGHLFVCFLFCFLRHLHWARERTKDNQKILNCPPGRECPKALFSPQIVGWFLCVEVCNCVVTRCWRSGGRRWMGSVRESQTFLSFLSFLSFLLFLLCIKALHHRSEQNQIF